MDKSVLDFIRVRSRYEGVCVVGPPGSGRILEYKAGDVFTLAEMGYDSELESGFDGWKFVDHINSALERIDAVEALLPYAGYALGMDHVPPRPRPRRFRIRRGLGGNAREVVRWAKEMAAYAEILPASGRTADGGRGPHIRLRKAIDARLRELRGHIKEAADLKKEAAGLRKRDESGDHERAIGKAAEPPGCSGAAVKAVAADAG